MKPFKPTIVVKVSMLAAGIAAIASLIIGSLVIRDAVDIVYQEELKYLRFVARIKARTLTSKIDGLYQDVRYLAGTPPVMGIPRARSNGGIDPLDQSSTERWKSRLAIHFTELIRAKPLYQQVRYIDASGQGQEMVRVDRLSGDINIRADDELQEKGHTDYFREASGIDPGTIYLSSISLNREHGRLMMPYTPVLRAVTPIYFEQKLFGVIVINMDLGGVFDDIITRKPAGTMLYVTNEQGDFLAHPNPAYTFGFDIGTRHRIQDRYPELTWNDKISGSSNGSTQIVEEDVVHIVKAHYDYMNPERFMAVVLSSTHKNLFSRANRIRDTSLLIMGILVFVSLVIAAVLARQLLMPMRLIARASEDLIKGDKVDYLPVDKDDEIGDLARSFEHMQAQLEEKNRQLLENHARSLHVNKLASLGEMASGMAHEINTPIQTINLIAQRIKHKKDRLSSGEIDDQMDKISASIDKVSRIIESLRKVSRESKNDRFDRVSVGELVDDATGITSQRFSIHNIDFTIEYIGISEQDIIECKRIQIAQILINLLNNAFDALNQLDHSWLRLEIMDAGDNIHFSLIDSGPAIDETVRHRMFEPLFTTKDIGKGTGLGLSISREIAQHHHGDLYFDEDSEYNRFVLTLPRWQKDRQPG